MKDYKSIEEFTFDDCSKYLHENPDSKYREIVENRFETVKAETENLDDEAFSNAKTIAGLKDYLETDFPGASYYQKKHVKEAEERLKIMIKEAEENVQKKKRAKRIKIGIISALAFLALALVCWLTYHPATYLSVSGYDGDISKYGTEIQLIYETDSKRVAVNGSPMVSKIERQEDRIYARIDSNYEDVRKGWLRVTAYSTMLGFNIGSKSKTIKLTQESGLANWIGVDISNIKVGKEGGTRLVTVGTDGTSWSASTSEEDSKWIHLKENYAEGTLAIKIDDNPDYVKTGYVYVYDNNSHRADIEIKQNGNPTIFELEANTIISSVSGGTYTIGVNTDNIDDLSVNVYLGNFITAEVNENDVIIRVEENNSSPQLGAVYVRCGDYKESITVYQQGYKECNRCRGSGTVLCGNRNMYGYHYFTDFWGNRISCPICKSMAAGRIECKNCEEGRIIADYVE